MAKKIGTLIKEARTGAGLTQEALAKKVNGVTASDISKAERNEKELTQTQLKQIAKACGVTQSSLLNAAKETTAKKTTTKKVVPASEKKTTTVKKTASSSATSTMKLTAAEKKLVELYRKATKEQKEEALKALKDDDDPDLLDFLGDILGKIL